MNNKIKSLIVSVLSIAMMVPAVSFAAENTTSTAKTANRSKYQTEIRKCTTAYTDTIKTANKTYADAIKKANSDYKSAISALKGTTDKTVLKEKKAEAIKARTEAKTSALKILKQEKKDAALKKNDCLKAARPSTASSTRQ